jgi:RNase H-like domain found in reverse transcriptase/Reverse transcriptase (RNA-dependent DNA polymerase)
LETLDDLQSFTVHGALIDSGVSDFGIIDCDFVKENQINTIPISKPCPSYNADGTRNQAGVITHYVPLRMRIGVHEEIINLLVSKLSSSKIFLGHEWLALHDPQVSWRDKTVEFSRCDSPCKAFIRSTSMVSPDDNSAAPDTPDYISEFPRVFSSQSFQELPPHRTWDHPVDLKEDGKDINDKAYSLSHQERKLLDDWIEENLKSGRIRPSTSRFSTLCFFRHDPKTRLCHDYRKLNNITIKNRYPLPRIRDLIDRLQGARFFSKMDVRWGFNNVRIRTGDEYKCAFTTHRGLFEPLVMQFGLCNAPSTFQKMMNEILREVIATGKVVVYIDDILVFTDNLEEHRCLVRWILRLLNQHNLFLKPEKCEFEKSKTIFLGMTISENQVQMSSGKVQSVLDWPTPRNKKHLQRFLGLVNYYRRFSQSFAEVARPLHKLTGNIPWEWGDEQEIAFRSLKFRLTSAPVLAMPDENKLYKVETDASKSAIGAVLSQKQDDGLWHPVEFFSRSMTPAEKNYQIYDQEMLAIIEALREWRQYLLGAVHPFEIWTDHLNLTYYRKPQNLTKRQARWITDLQEYVFTIHHIPGRLNTKADTLSRRPDYMETDDEASETLGLPPTLF